MVAVEIVRAILIVYAAFWTCYVVLPPLLAIFRRSRNACPARGVADAVMPRIAVLIPAHNMEAVIAACLDSLLSCDYPKDRVRIFVIADHCTDQTAERAEASGATALNRNVGPAGKTYALGWAIDELAHRRVDADLYVITDATARVKPRFLAAFAARWVQGEDIAIGHSVLDSNNTRWFAQCLGLALVHRTVQNRARECLGLSALIIGCGMAYSRQYIQQYGWRLALPTEDAAGSHPTEDWRHGVRAVEHGLRAAFTEDARVITPLRASLGAATQQGVRWERGRIANASTHGLRTLALGFRRRNGRLIMAALDAIQPPVAILAAACLVLAVCSVLLPGSPLAFALGIAPFLLLGIYGLFVIAEGRREGIKATTLLWAPLYVGWRTLAFATAWIASRVKPREPGRLNKHPGGPTR